MDSLLAYIQQLELILFFSAYPLIYAAVILVTRNPEKASDAKGLNARSRLLWVLPYAYALVGTLYLGFFLKNIFPDYTLNKIRMAVYLPFLVSWGMLSVMFWIPFLAKRKFLTLLHSLVFFFLVVKDTVLQISGSASDMDILKNDMRVFTDSLLLHIAALFFLYLLSFVVTRNKGDQKGR